MSTIAKKNAIDFVAKKFAESEVVFFVNFKGVSVAAERVLRSELRGKSATMRVAKARLIKRALDSVGVMEANPDLQSLIGGQIAVVFSAEDSQFVAKSLVSFQRKTGREVFVTGGVYKNSLCDKAEVVSMAKLPGKEALVQRLAFAINYPLTSLAMTVKEVAEKAK